MSRRWDGYLTREPTGKVVWYEIEADRPEPLKWMDRLCGRPCESATAVPGSWHASWAWNPGAGPLGGVFATVYVYYLASGGARAAVVVADDATFSAVVAENTVVVPEVMAYRPGEFYRRELPPLRAVLRGVAGLGLLIVDGYADLDPSGRPGLGAHAYAEFGIPVVGVAKSAFLSATHAIPVLRGTSAHPCSSPPLACPAPTQLIWSGTWPAGSGYPLPCAMSIRWRGPGSKQTPASATVRSNKTRLAAEECICAWLDGACRCAEETHRD